jgi:hypothetical protein
MCLTVSNHAADYSEWVYGIMVEMCLVMNY